MIALGLALCLIVLHLLGNLDEQKTSTNDRGVLGGPRLLIRHLFHYQHHQETRKTIVDGSGFRSALLGSHCFVLVSLAPSERWHRPFLLSYCRGSWLIGGELCMTVSSMSHFHLVLGTRVQENCHIFSGHV